MLWNLSIWVKNMLHKLDFLFFIWLLYVFRRKKKTSTLDQGSKLTPWHGTLIGSLFWPSLHGKKLLFLMVFLACSLVATKDCCMQVLYWYILVYFMMYFAGYLGPRLMTTVIWYTRVRVGCSIIGQDQAGQAIRMHWGGWHVR